MGSFFAGTLANRNLPRRHKFSSQLSATRSRRTLFNLERPLFLIHNAFLRPVPMSGTTVPIGPIAVVQRLIQRADQVISFGYEFASKKGVAESVLLESISETYSLKGILEYLGEIITNGQILDEPRLHRICDPEGPLGLCDAALLEIQATIRRAQNQSRSSTQKGIQRCMEIISKQRSIIMLILQGGRQEVRMKEDSKVLDGLRSLNKRDAEIIVWLKRTDSFNTHARAREICGPGTGEWFISSAEFLDWFNLVGRSMWMYGKPGAGKTVLCSSIIEAVKLRCSSNAACLFFYFDFKQKWTVANMLYSFLEQLSLSTVHRQLHDLFELCNLGTREASVNELVGTLLSIAKAGQRMYIIVDALDEAKDMNTLLNVLQGLLHCENINLLVTSRKERSIDAMSNSVDCIVSLDRTAVDDDIRRYLEHCIQTDRSLSRLHTDTKSMIEGVLVDKAHGMYASPPHSTHTNAP